jgi:hypothetical protein
MSQAVLAETILFWHYPHFKKVLLINFSLSALKIQYLLLKYD